MKKLLILMSFFAIISLSASNSFGQALYFKITNNSNFRLYGVYISPHDQAEDWSDDLCTAALFNPGVEVEIYIPEDYYPTLSLFDVKVTYYGVDGNFYEKTLCYVDALTYTSLLINSDWSCVYEY